MPFDVKVHHWDSKTGKLKEKTPYKFVSSKSEGKYFVRGGKKYHPDGSEIAEPVLGKDGKEKQFKAATAPVAEKAEPKPKGPSKAL